MIINFIISLVLLFSTNSSLEKRIDDYLKIELAEYTKYEFKIKSIPGRNTNGNSIIIDSKKEFKLSGKYCYIPVIVKKGNRDFSSVISLEIKLYDEVFVARRVLKKGENLSRSDFNISLDEITKYKNLTVSKNTPVEFFRVKRKIKIGEILTSDKIEGIPVIKKGDRIMANLINGSVHISMEAIAKQDGLIGEKIRIISDKKHFKAEVIDSYNVKIIE